MNRLTPSPEFVAEAEQIKRAYPEAYVRAKAVFMLLRNAEPRTMDGVDWNEDEGIYTLTIDEADLGCLMTIEVDFALNGQEIILAAIQVV